MGRHSIERTLPVQSQTTRTGDHGRHQRAPWSLPVFAFFTTLSFVLAAAIDPSVAAEMVTQARGAGTVAAAGAAAEDLQSIAVADDATTTVADGGDSRDPFTVSEIVTYPAAPAAGVPDPGTAQAIARDMLRARGWGEDQYRCLVSLWNKESRWNVSAHNVASGAYGIPQALPGSKMASAGADWKTNPGTQITWGLGYIAARYGTPCGAWASSQERGWY